MLTRVSRRASEPPGQLWTPRPKARCSRGVVTVDPELGGVVEVAGITVRRPVEHHQRGSGGDVDAGHGGRAPGQSEVALHRGLDPEGLLHEVGDEVVALRSSAAGRGVPR